MFASRRDDVVLRRSRLDELEAVQLSSPRAWAPVGTVEFCVTWMRRLGIATPPHMTYPPALHGFLGRQVVQARWIDVADGEFAKPLYRIKAWTGHVKGRPHPDDAEIIAALDPNEPVWRSEPVEFVSETRFYLIDGAIAGATRYDDGPDNTPEPDRATVAAAAALTDPTIGGMTLDFGVTSDGRTLLVEANDGWAIGYYPWGDMSQDRYAELVLARWRTLVSRNASPRTGRGDDQNG